MSAARRFFTSLLAMMIAVLMSAAVAQTASAHSTQIGSTPAADEVLTEAPQEITIEFDTPLIDLGTAIAVRGSDKESVVTGKPVVTDRLLSVAVDPAAPADTYHVAYRVVSEDGHTIVSTFTYTVAGGLSPTPSAASPPPSAASLAATTASPEPTVAAESTSDSGSISPVLIAVAVALIVILAFAGAIALRR